MIDLRLDTNTHDLIIEDFTFKTVIDKADEITQRLKVKLLWFREEWFNDRTFGVPYYQEIFDKGTTKQDVDDIYKALIVDEEGVVSLVSYESTYTPETRILTVKCKVQVENGEILALSFNV